MDVYTRLIKLEKLLLEIYDLGWSCKDKDLEYEKSLIMKAFEIGSDHYVLGDDVKSFDNLTKDEILNLIMNIKPFIKIISHNGHLCEKIK